jgi:hypothetical protein
MSKRLASDMAMTPFVAAVAADDENANSGERKRFRTFGGSQKVDSRVARAFGPPNILLPLEEVKSEDDRRLLSEIDAKFSETLDAARSVDDRQKVYQKRLTVRSDRYVIGYGWKHHPRFYLSAGTLAAFVNEHLEVVDVKFNPSGGCCSLESNSLVGIATPCYCDDCRASRTTNSRYPLVEEATERSRAGPDVGSRFLIEVKRSGVEK